MDDVEQSQTTNENPSIESYPNDDLVDLQLKKPKRPRTENQKVAFQKCQQARLEKLKQRRQSTPDIPEEYVPIPQTESSPDPDPEPTPQTSERPPTPPPSPVKPKRATRRPRKPKAPPVEIKEEPSFVVNFY
jgi:hypothetical protein